jgi:hypothetical protein
MKSLGAVLSGLLALGVVGCAASGAQPRAKKGLSPARCERLIQRYQDMGKPEVADRIRAKCEAAGIVLSRPAETAAAAPPPATARVDDDSVGVGAALAARDGKILIAALIPGGAAAKDGRARVGDAVDAVAQGDGAWAPTEGMSAKQVEGLIRGDGGTIVRLKLARPGADAAAQSSTISLVRAPIDASASAAASASSSAAAPAPAEAPTPAPAAPLSPEQKKQADGEIAP